MIALRERNFRLYWLGQAVSNTGNWMQIVALSWFVLQLTGNPITIGLLGLAQSLPVFALSLVGGMLADHFPRLQLLIVTQSSAMLLAFILAFLAATGKPPIWSLLLVAALAATVTAIDNPARQAFLSDLVDKEALLNAVSLNASVYNGAAVIGPTLAGLLLLHAGAAGCFAFNALSFLAVVCALIMIAHAKDSAQKKRLDSEKIATHRDTAAPVSPVRAFWQLHSERSILAILGIAAAASLLGRPYLLLMPAFARTVQHVGPEQLGLMVAASGAGSFLGSIALATLNTSQHLQRLLLICGIGFGIVLALFALTPLFPLATLILIACGAGATMTMTIANTLLQTQAPSGMRGRVMSLYTLIAAGLTPLGALVISSLGAGIGLSMATAIMGAGIVICVVVGYWYLT
ncbi:MAG TPA: MFS transporter [Ktedonobacteraceae bacterium]|nr:MFS transporter [Ktedonobacteraceae bacterium]